MALIVVKALEEIGDVWPNTCVPGEYDCRDEVTQTWNPLIYFESVDQIQSEFCRLLEMASEKGVPSFLETPVVRDYLKQFGVRYLGDYKFRFQKRDVGKAGRKSEFSLGMADRVKSNKFQLEDGPNGKNKSKERYVTCLNYPLQLACLALYYQEVLPESRIVLTDRCGRSDESAMRDRYIGAFDPVFSAPMLMKRDVYLYMTKFYRPGFWLNNLLDLMDNGCEIVLEGVSSKRFDDDREQYEDFIFNVEYAYTQFSKELDKEYYPQIPVSHKIPFETSLREYVFPRGEDGEPLYDTMDEEAFEGVLRVHPEYARTKVVVNGDNTRDARVNYSSDEKYVTVIRLSRENGKWKYYETNAIKYPTAFEILLWAVLDYSAYFDHSMDDDMMNEWNDEETGDGEGNDVVRNEGEWTEEGQNDEEQKETEQSEEDLIFAMVLDGEGGCEAREYWKHVSFFAKYDKTQNQIEICEKNHALMEFHEILQQAERSVAKPEDFTSDWQYLWMKEIKEKFGGKR